MAQASNPERDTAGPAAKTGRSRFGAQMAKSIGAKDDVEGAIAVMSRNSRLILAAKDLDSRHIRSTDACARLVGLNSGAEIMGRSDWEMPCEGTVRFADTFVAEDRAVMARGADGAVLKVLHVHEYATGLGAFIFEKSALLEPASGKVRGTLYFGYEVNPAPFLPFVPKSQDRSVRECGMKYVTGGIRLGTAKLSEYEHEVSYLLALGWKPRQIARYLDEIRPRGQARSPNAIEKCRSRVGIKLGYGSLAAAGFREAMVAAGLLSKMPSTLVWPLVGATLLDDGALGAQARRNVERPGE